MSLFITFEGVEGCGKSTQSKRLEKKLHDAGHDVLLTFEPGATGLGQRINDLLKWQADVPVNPLAELLLFNADRAQHVSEVIVPALKKNTIVLCDRYADSTTAYQGYARGLGMDTVMAANDIGTQGLVPDLTILLDVPVEDGMKRKREDTPDRFETEAVAFHQRVRDGYLDLAQKEPERWFIIDGTLEMDVITDIIRTKVERLLTGED